MRTVLISRLTALRDRLRPQKLRNAAETFLLRKKGWILLVALAVPSLFMPAFNLCFPIETHRDYSTVVYASDSTILHAFLTIDDKWRMKTEMHEITPTLKKAIIKKEDRYFYYHKGVNLLAVGRALINNIIHGKRTSGASTITMQLARLLYPKPRTYANKIEEMLRAWQLEYLYSKNEIFQLYINLLPYGGNIEGIKAASVIYLQKSPELLSLAEITALAIIPNRPNSLTPGPDNNLIVAERNKWLQRFAGVFPKKDIEEANNEPFEAQRHDIPHLAPHYALRLKRMFPERANIYGTLKPDIQSNTEKLVANYVNRFHSANIHNAAVLVLDNRNMHIAAYLGSSNFYDDQNAGQVDGIKAIRSPGSTLKPLLYAVAFEKGLLTPQMVLTDVPLNFNGYEPENYDEHFNGPVTVEFALKQSLNVPAVKTLDEISPEVFIEYLEKAGFSQIGKDRKKLGLSLILGGCGVTLEQLTSLYATLAHNGLRYPFCWTTDSKLRTPTRLISSGSAFMATDILSKLSRPDLPVEWDKNPDMPHVAWKTGTSYGRKDAWSIGYNKNYTIGVWVGNFSGKGVPGLNGAETAAPLLFALFNYIDYHSPDDWYQPPHDIDFRVVCRESGLIPNSFCTSTTVDFYIPTISPNRHCNHLREVLVSPDSSLSFCNTCVPATGYKKKFYANLPPELVAFYDESGIPYEKIPPHNPDCKNVFTHGGPVISSPLAHYDYLIDKADSTEIMLKCQTSNDVDTVFWYVNNRFLQKAGAGDKLFFLPPEGKIKISCTDDKGRNSDLWVNVKYVRF